MGMDRWDLEGPTNREARRPSYELIYYPPNSHSGGRIRMLFERIRINPGGDIYLSEGGCTLVAHFSAGIIPKYMVDRLRKIAVASKGGKE